VWLLNPHYETGDPEEAERIRKEKKGQVRVFGFGGLDMAERALLDDVADIVRQILGYNRGQQSLRHYAWQLSSICDLLSHTHSIVIDKLDGIEETKSLEEAKILVKGLAIEPLTDSFRVNGLCDIFMGFGIALRKAVIQKDAPNPSENKLVAMTDKQWYSWMRFCDALEQREQEVASLYVYEIRELSDILLEVDSATDLDGLKTKAGRVRAVLTTQKADFDSLATQFRQALPG
jgi:hypothetical protein